MRRGGQRPVGVGVQREHGPRERGMVMQKEEHTDPERGRWWSRKVRMEPRGSGAGGRQRLREGLGKEIRERQGGEKDSDSDMAQSHRNQQDRHS